MKRKRIMSDLHPSKIFPAARITALALALLVAHALVTPSRVVRGERRASPPRPTPKLSGLENLPLAFVPEAGLTNGAVKFQARGLSAAVFFGSNDVAFSLPPPRDPRAHTEEEAETRRSAPLNV